MARSPVQEYWEKFSTNRFTVQDVWEHLWGRYKWPFHEDKLTILRNIQECGEDIELAPGKRGGQGWRVSAAAAARLEAKAKTAQGELERVEDAVFKLHVYTGKVRINPHERRVEWTSDFPFEVDEWIRKKHGSKALRLSVPFGKVKKLQAIISDHENKLRNILMIYVAVKQKEIAELQVEIAKIIRFVDRRP